jgi:CBS domain-containing protein
VNATVSDVMTTSLIAVRGDTSFKEMAAMLGSSRVSAFPVIDQAGKVIGVVSETDILIKEADQASHPGPFAGLRRSRDHEKAAGVTAAELMTSPPVTIGPGDLMPSARVMDRWETARLRWVPAGEVGRYPLHAALPEAWAALSAIVTKEGESS